MKNMHEGNKINDSHAECNMECNFKTKMINPLLENLSNNENHHQTKLDNGNTTLKPGEADDDYQLPKKQVCKKKFQSQTNPQLTLSNRYKSLRDYDIFERNDNVIVTKASANEISNDIIEVALCKFDNSNVLVSCIVPPSDKLNAKPIKVNKHLKNECRKRNIYFISNSNINPKYDCNKSVLHLNLKGTNKLAENFLFALSKFDS